MVSTHFFVPLFREAILPLLLAFPMGVNGPPQQLQQRVDLIELNHYFDDSGGHAYDQIIFYEWSPDYRRYHVIAWSLVENDLGRIPVYDRNRDLHVVDWYDRDLKRRRSITSALFRETWSQVDPERANKKLLDEKDRISLLRIDKHQCLR